MFFQKTKTDSFLHSVVIVSALGYFVDVYDLLLFTIVRTSSLASLNVTGSDVTIVGIELLNVQMIGMFCGGIICGILGDKMGRNSTLYFTILCYSTANIANGFVTNLNQYFILRFIAGFGLAGELGLGVTLVSETLHKSIRGYGTTLVTVLGAFGAVIAFLVSNLFNWKVAYIVGGILGLLLLLLRFVTIESQMFHDMKTKNIARGNFFQIFSKKIIFIKYLKYALIGLPVWFVIGIVLTFSPEIASANALDVQGEVSAGKSVFFFYVSNCFGCLGIGFLSQWLKIRKKLLVLVLLSLTTSLLLFFSFVKISANHFYLMISLIGFEVGYWSIFIAATSEAFGTNIRATVTSSIPNIVRGFTVILTLFLNYFMGYFGLITAALMVGLPVLILAIIAASRIQETATLDLDYYEE